MRNKRLKGRVEHGILFLIASILAISLRVVYETAHSPHLVLLSSDKNILQVHLDQFSHHSFQEVNVTTVAMRRSQVLVVPPLYPDSVDPFYTIPSDGTNVWDQPPTSQLLPEWMKAYFNWHKHQRQTVLLMKDDVTKWKTQRWLVLQCLAGQDPLRCGGTADRLVRPTIQRLVVGWLVAAYTVEKN